jgi:glyoxylase-like metal-dependent hydrolase (beta-lactamase superfamily II)
VVLVDTGSAQAGTPGAQWIGTSGRLPDELAAAGVHPEEADVVVLPHLHLDHVGWNLAWDDDRPAPRFP